MLVVYPDSYEVNPPAISERGSSATGHCSNVSDSGRVCNTPRTSVLFDGIIAPPVIEGDLKAMDLLTLNTSISSTITFNFNTPFNSSGNVSTYQYVRIMQVCMFNCPTRGIGAKSIGIRGDDNSDLETSVDIPQSCEYLVLASVGYFLPSYSRVSLYFTDALHRVYLAEVYVAEVKFSVGFTTCYNSVNNETVPPYLASTIMTTSTPAGKTKRC